MLIMLKLDHFEDRELSLAVSGTLLAMVNVDVKTF